MVFLRDFQVELRMMFGLWTRRLRGAAPSYPEASRRRPSPEADLPRICC